MLVRAGVQIFAPVVNTHPLVEHGLPIEWSFWSQFDQTFLEICDAVIVLQLEGWEQSVGIQEELRLAEEMGIAIYHLEPGEIEAWTAEFMQLTATA
jgi:hypothetical protein